MRTAIFICLTLFSVVGRAQGIKISALPAASTLTGAELIPLNQGTTTKKATVNQLATYIGSGGSGAWLTTGNIGTTAGTNFIGTTDAADLLLSTKSAPNIKLTHTDGEGGEYISSVIITDSTQFALLKTLSLNSFGETRNIKIGDAEAVRNNCSVDVNVSSNTVTITSLITTVNDSITVQNGKLAITDGTQGSGKVLTSDANGLASWMGTAFTQSDSATIYGSTRPIGTTYTCTDCSGTGITGRIVYYMGGAWRRVPISLSIP